VRGLQAGAKGSRSGLPKIAQPLSSISCTQRTPAGFAVEHGVCRN
jgi:hypothetical protein